MRPETASPRKKTLSGKRSAWITPCGSACGQAASSASSSPPSSSARPGRTSSRAAAAGVVERPPAGDAQIVGPRHARNAARRRCSRASAPPSAGAMERLDAARPHAVEEASRSPPAGRTAGAAPRRPARGSASGRRCRCAARCSISARKNGRSAGATRLLVERQDIGAALGAQQVVRVLDALGDALARHHLAEIVMRRRSCAARRRERRYRRPFGLGGGACVDGGRRSKFRRHGAAR